MCRLNADIDKFRMNQVCLLSTDFYTVSALEVIAPQDIFRWRRVIMYIHANSERGFSLIELLVVIAIIGVLAAVGVVGYQGYIDSTKKSVTEANAKAVQQWVLNTDTVRAAGIDADPTSCSANSASSEATIQACLSVIGSTDGPFASFKNPYNTSRTGDTAIRGLLSNSSITSGSTLCSAIDANAVNGDVLVSTSGTLIQTHYCVPSGSTSVLVTETGWDVDWD